MPRAPAAWLAVALVAALVVAVPGASAGDPAPRPTRILILGDSVAQGSTGDYTWRYRLWRHLVDASVPVDLVGPHTGLHDLTTGGDDNHDYAVAAFDDDHAARWGMTLGFADQPPDELVRAHHPDVVVEMPGLNDLLFLHLTTEQLLDEVRDFVVRARSADPGITIVVGSIPQTWYAGVDAYNAALGDLVAGLDTPDSRVVATGLPDDFVRTRDTWDDTHPSATGEVAIAGVVADALAGLGIGPAYVAPSPPVVNGPVATATDVRAVATDGTVTLSWRNPPGQTGERVETRDVTVGAPWTRLAGDSGAADVTRTVSGLVEGHVHAFRLQAFKGSAVAVDRYSAVATSTPAPIPAPSPGSAPTPAPVRAAPAVTAPMDPVPMRAPRPGGVDHRRVTLRWQPVAAADHYVVQLRRRGAWVTRGRSTATQLRTRALAPGRHRLRVVALRGAVQVGASASVRVRVV